MLPIWIFLLFRKELLMIHISGHLRDTRREEGFEDTTRPLVVNCCGYQKFLTKDYSKQRPRGRLDYHMIYLYKGSGSFVIQGNQTTVPAGSILLFSPSEPEFFSYQAKDAPEIYWIHFTGSECGELLDRYSLESCAVGESPTLKQLFSETIRELQLKNPGFETVVLCNFYKMLVLINRLRLRQELPGGNQLSIEKLVSELYRRYSEPWTLDSMAEYCGLSAGYFSHSFKKRMGCPPMQFLQSLRIGQAKELLLSDSLTVSAVAALVGYEDPLYFSKVFKKETGLPPRVYQNQN